MEEIFAKIFERAPDVLMSLKDGILEKFGPWGLIIAIILTVTMIVISIVKLLQFLFKVIIILAIPVILAIYITQQFEPSYVQYVIPITASVFSKFLFDKFRSCS